MRIKTVDDMHIAVEDKVCFQVPSGALLLIQATTHPTIGIQLNKQPTKARVRYGSISSG